MLFKLLADYKPKGVAVAWDTRPVHRAAVSEDYKSERRPMPDLLREQFPHFRPIVEAFGYRNLEFEGWEADDVIATLATQADEAGIKTTVVSTDRDAFQLVTENVALMMTPRGVSDVNVYTPDRVEARYGIRPDQVPDFIGLKGDTSDNIPGVPGIGDKTAGQLIAQYGSLEEVIAHADELSPARAKNITEHADQARQSKELATMRRDLELDCDRDAARPPAAGPLAAEGDVPPFEFREPAAPGRRARRRGPAPAPMQLEETTVPWREELVQSVTRRRGGDRGRGGRIAVAVPERVVVSPRPALARRASCRPRRQGAARPGEGRHAAPRVPDRAVRPAYPLDELAAEYGLELKPDPAAEEETAALVRHAAATLRLRDLLVERVRERGMEPLYREDRAPALAGAGRDGGHRREDRRVPDGRDHGAAARDGSRSSRRAPTTSPARSSCSARRSRSAGSCSRSSASRPGARARRATRPTRASCARSAASTRSSRVIEEWREYSKLLNTYLGPLPSLIAEDGRLHTTINQAVAATGRLSTTNPNLQAIPIRTELGREIRSAFIAEPGNKLLSADYSQIELRILAHVSGEPKLREAFARGEDIHTATAVEVLGVEPAELTSAQRSVAKMINFGIVYGISSFGLSENLEIPREEAQQYIDAYLARFPHVQDFIRRTIEQSERDGYATSLLGRRRPVQELRAQNRQTRSLGERLAVNFVMQGSNADIIKVAMVRIHDRLREEGRGARLVLQVHDELLLEVPDAEVGAVKELVRDEMVGAYDLDPPLAVDVGTGDDWSEAKS